jgi:hypothetical protein
MENPPNPKFNRADLLRALGMKPEDLTRQVSEGALQLSIEKRFKLGEMLPAAEPVAEIASVPLLELEKLFFDWLDASVADAPLAKIKAFNVCLYEGVDCFEADFFGCPKYTPKEPDWACTWCHEGKSRFGFNSDEIEPEWEEGLRVAKGMLRRYLKSKRAGARRLHQIGVVTIGFSDGDLNVVLSKSKSRPKAKPKSKVKAKLRGKKR